MSRNWNQLAQFSVIAAVCSLAFWIGSTNAEEASVLVNKPAASSPAVVESGPELPPPVDPTPAPASVNNATSSGDVFAPPLSPATKETLPTPPQSPPASSAVKRPFLRPDQPRSPASGKLVGAEPMPVPPQGQPPIEGPAVSELSLPPGIQVRPTPPIDYATDHDARTMYRSAKVKFMVLAKDPAEGCAYQIRLCTAAYRTGAPRGHRRHALLVRG